MLSKAYLGATAGALATLATHPFDVMKVRAVGLGAL